MWNESNFLKLYVDVKRRAGGRIWIPLIVCLQCLASYIEDLADLCALFPDRMCVRTEKGADMTMGQTTAMLRAVSEVLRGMNDMRIRVKVAEHNGDSVHVDIGAL